MLLTPLGHTEFLIEINNTQNESIKIMVDAWLSDYVLWDLMERSVQVVPNYENLKNLDAIYISHSHSDHFDPYTLTKIFANTSLKKPLLILPFTLEYLVPLIREYLGEIEIKILFPNEDFVLHWVTITGYMFEQSNITNEDDVMMLAVSNADELVFAEIDTLPEEDNPEVQKKLYQIFTRKKYKTALYLASRNELEGQIPLLDTPQNKRRKFRNEYISNRKEMMRYGYEKFECEEFEEFPNLYNIRGFCRGFIGQGIIYPKILSRELADISIFPLEEIASLESDYAHNHGYTFPQKALLPGRQYIIENGTINAGRKECLVGKLIVHHEKNLEFSWERIYSKTPLLPHYTLNKSEEEYVAMLEYILNNKFLPYWSASPVASFRDGVIKNHWKYSIIFLDNERKPKVAFEYSLAWEKFLQKNTFEIINSNEVYFYRDIIDFIEWRQELYSNFWHELDTSKIYRLWTCLGANFINHDIVINKYRFHFERARNGENINSFVEPILKKIKNEK